MLPCVSLRVHKLASIRRDAEIGKQLCRNEVPLNLISCPSHVLWIFNNNVGNQKRNLFKSPG